MEKDRAAVAATIRVLAALGCPNVRRGQGNPEFMAVQTPNARTPDIIAGPLHGFADRRDFYIDVQQPSGDYFTQAQAGVPAAKAMFDRAESGLERPQLHRLDVDHFKPFLLKQLETKLGKYVGQRGSPLYGHVYYFGGPDPTKQSIWAWSDSMRAFGGMVAVDHGDEQGQKTIDIANSTQTTVQVRTVDWPTSMCLLANVLRTPSNVSVLVLVIHHALGEHEFRGHPVVEWLRRLVEGGPIQPSLAAFLRSVVRV